MFSVQRKIERLKKTIIFIKIVNMHDWLTKAVKKDPDANARPMVSSGQIILS